MVGWGILILTNFVPKGYVLFVMVVFTMDYDFLFHSILGHCARIKDIYLTQETIRNYQNSYAKN